MLTFFIFFRFRSLLLLLPPPFSSEELLNEAETVFPGLFKEDEEEEGENEEAKIFTLKNFSFIAFRGLFALFLLRLFLPPPPFFFAAADAMYILAKVSFVFCNRRWAKAETPSSEGTKTNARLPVAHLKAIHFQEFRAKGTPFRIEHCSKGSYFCTAENDIPRTRKTYFDVITMVI